MQNEQIAHAARIVRAFQHYEYSGHDYSHSERVMALALKIAESEGGDHLVIAISALLHDLLGLQGSWRRWSSKSGSSTYDN